jgi:hypothetical protein
LKAGRPSCAKLNSNCKMQNAKCKNERPADRRIPTPRGPPLLLELEGSLWYNGFYLGMFFDNLVWIPVRPSVGQALVGRRGRGGRGRRGVAKSGRIVAKSCSIAADSGSIVADSGTFAHPLWRGEARTRRDFRRNRNGLLVRARGVCDKVVSPNGGRSDGSREQFHRSVGDVARFRRNCAGGWLVRRISAGVVSPVSILHFAFCIQYFAFAPRTMVSRPAGEMRSRRQRGGTLLEGRLAVRNAKCKMEEEDAVCVGTHVLLCDRLQTCPTCRLREEP